MILNHWYNYRFIGPNKDIQQKYPQHEYHDSFENLDTLPINKKSILVVSWWRSVLFDQVSTYRERIKAILSRWVWMDNFGNLSDYKEIWILTWNNPWHSQYNTFLHSLGFLYQACQLNWISSLEQLKEQKILIIWRWVISQTLSYFLSLLGLVNIERVSSLHITNEITSNKDIIFICTSLQPDNIYKLDKTILSKFKWTLINTSRDKLVDEEYIKKRVSKGTLSYITDVYWHILKDYVNSNLITTPHIGWRSSDIEFVISSLIKNLQLILQDSQMEHQVVDFTQVSKSLEVQDLQQLDFTLLQQVYQSKIVNWKTINDWILWKVKLLFG